MAPTAPKTCPSPSDGLSPDAKSMFDRLKRDFTGLNSPIGLFDDLMHCRNWHVESIGVPQIHFCELCNQKSKESTALYTDSAKALHELQEALAEDQEETTATEWSKDMITNGINRLATVVLGCLSSTFDKQAPIEDIESDAAKAMEARSNYHKTSTDNAEALRAGYMEQEDAPVEDERPLETRFEAWKQEVIATQMNMYERFRAQEKIEQEPDWKDRFQSNKAAVSDWTSTDKPGKKLSVAEVVLKIFTTLDIHLPQQPSQVQRSAFDKLHRAIKALLRLMLQTSEADHAREDAFRQFAKYREELRAAVNGHIKGGEQRAAAADAADVGLFEMFPALYEGLRQRVQG